MRVGGIGFVAVLAGLGLAVPAPVRPAATGDSLAVLATTDSTAGDSLVALVQPLFAVVERLRGARFLHAVPVHVVSDSLAQVHFRARIDDFEPAERLESDATAYAQLGFLPAGTDLKSLLLDVLEEQAGGYYSPEDNAFYLLADMPRAILPVLAVHELTHADDDQHFAIDSTLARCKDDNDRASAFGGVVEGSGTLVMNAYMLGELQSGRMNATILQEFTKTDAGKAAKLLGAPPLLRRTLLAPYLLGQSFLLRGDPNRLLAGIVPADLDRAFRDPPVSTEQLLHPEKYWDETRRDLPRSVPDVDLSAQLGAGWNRTGDGTLGELLIGLLAGAHDPELTSLDIADPAKWTSKGAAGWGGDHWWLYAHGDAHLTVLATLWDTPADAREFVDALTVPKGSRAFRQADAVVVVAGDHAELAPGAAKACLAALAPARRAH